MTTANSGIYCGNVVHKRVRPTPHALDYKVFSFLLDIDEIALQAKRLRFFSYNAWNIFSFHDRDHGDGGETPIRDIALEALAAAKRPSEGRRILLLAYPRIFGYVFNPVSFFACYA